MMTTRFALLTVAVLAAGCGDSTSKQDSGTTDTGTTDTPTDTMATTDGGNADGTNATCSTCAMTSCSTQLTACNADTACKCTYDCKIMGGAEGSCKAMCSANNNTAWSDLVGCLDTMCVGSC
ncbi:MAG TPA: hypothetical protein VLB44_15060 [Kofleriaceae bacterium]|nr:hypothetical protein [Kofleriaceae bacterium]